MLTRTFGGQPRQHGSGHARSAAIQKKGRSDQDRQDWRHQVKLVSKMSDRVKERPHVSLTAGVLNRILRRAAWRRAATMMR